ncbi:enoyl-CoA hydratase/isomerase family protein [Amycolatopsis mongoliensis]|uniref:Enoyl-CoA hydratase/isomerase family protein n=1 Tax=Amycolatopsis mongoliensis TaxID=715475 RepID=A0A9Y2JP77_9PSEU|nr:enoyl-CoA hydratase/isomerase family protein [Amycolatopsis sp. 4-36]WIY00997.1 enoyl-CoA hydratase/isomerase family protein [Amycolatopsis sp. 4-36]
MPKSGAVRTTREGSVATITLANGSDNLLDPVVMNALHDAISAADEDREILAIVLAADGERFCGGLDVAELQRGGDPAEFATALVKLLKLLPRIGTALVAAVHGDALASGFSIVCCCDLAVAAPQARLGTFEAGIGIWPMIAQVPPLQRMLPRHALRNIITGVPFSAAEAERFGAITKIAAGRVRSEARELAEAASVAGRALAAGRRSFYRFTELPYEDALDAALDSFTTMLSTSPNR